MGVIWYVFYFLQGIILLKIISLLIMKSINKFLIALTFFLGLVTANAQSKWVAPSSADSVSNPTKDFGGSVKAGAVLFKAQCVMCHGIKGNGKGVAGVYLTPTPANFTSPKVQSQTDGALFWKLSNGNSPMASYKDIFTEKQRWNLINYIRTFKTK
jgi:mono/diheme cytochrome c family protein